MFANGIFNSTQRGAELAMQQTPTLNPNDPAQLAQINTTGSTSVGNTYLVSTQKANNSLGELIVSVVEKGAEVVGATGGIQGAKGTLFGIPYEAGSWQDKLIESFSGTHDLIGGKVSGLYDAQGNIKRGMTDMERSTYNNAITTSAIPIATPFAIAEALPPEIWKAISVLLGVAK